VSNPGLVMKFEKLSRCAELWEPIFEKTGDASPFISYEWYYALCSNLLKNDPEVILFSDNSQTVGIVPACLDDDTLRMIGDERVTDLNDVICLPGYEHKISETIASFIESNKLHVDLFPLDSNSPLIRYLPRFLDALKIDEADTCPILLLPHSWDQYLQFLSSKSRHELRRKLRKAMGTNVKTIEPGQIDLLFKSMSISDKNKEDFLTPDVCGFFKMIAVFFHEKGWLRFRAAFVNAQPIAALFAFAFKRRIYLYNTGFEPEYGDLSPGIVTIGLDIKDAIDEGFKVYDFLRGGEEYKFRFGAQERYTMRVKG